MRKKYKDLSISKGSFGILGRKGSLPQHPPYPAEGIPSNGRRAIFSNFPRNLANYKGNQQFLISTQNNPGGGVSSTQGLIYIP